MMKKKAKKKKLKIEKQETSPFAIHQNDENIQVKCSLKWTEKPKEKKSQPKKKN